MERSKLVRPILLCVAAAAWCFLLISFGSFHSSDWPSHSVYPYAPTQNLCGSVGAFVAYYAFLAIGQGVFPLLFFSGVCLALIVYQNRVSDVWLRVVGLLVLCTAFAAIVHHIKPGAQTGFPEGQGGVIGIGTAAFLQAHFNTIGTRLILMTAVFVGLLLAADDIVLRAPEVMGLAYSQVRAATPKIKFNFASLPTLPSLPKFVTRDAAPAKPARAAKKAEPKAPKAAAAIAAALSEEASGDAEKAAPIVLKRSSAAALKPADSPAAASLPVNRQIDAGANESRSVPSSEVGRAPYADEPVVLDYKHDDEPGAADDGAMQHEADPGPSASAVIPPADEQAVPEVRKEIVVKLPSALKPRNVSPPTAPPKELGEYHLPAWDCLAEAEHGFAESQEKFVREQAAVLEQALKEFNIDAHVVEIDTGPVITMYELALAPGIKVSTISGLSNDIQRSLKAETVRIVAPIPGKNTVGIEVPNAQKEKVRLKELMQLAPEAMRKMTVPLFLGKDASGEPLITDLTRMPHCLIAGTTGSGKSVCINTIIMSVMYLQRPDVVKLILVDPKVVEMAPFKDIPHLMCPVINDAVKATSVLEWACEKMDERYDFLAEAGVRNIADYNKLTRDELVERFQPTSPEDEAKIPKQIPYIIIIVDELADLMMTSGKEVEAFIVRLAQKSRAVGIHLILATQRPSANVVTGLIKSNMPSRIAFRVSSKMDSRIVLDQNGADLLLGHGDMLFLPPGASKPTRSQGTYIDDKEIRDSVKIVKGSADAQYEPELVQIKNSVNMDGEIEKDELFDDAVRVVLETKRGSVSLLQRRLTIGYARASRLIEMMAQTGIVGDYKGSQAREAMLTLEEWDAMKAQQQADADSGMTV